MARRRKWWQKLLEPVHKMLVSWPASAQVVIIGMMTFAVAGWALWDNQVARNQGLVAARDEMHEALKDYRIRFSKFRKKVEEIELAADRQYPGVDGAKRLSLLIADVKQARHLGAKKKFVRPNARLRYETARPIQKAILKHHGVAAHILVVARQGEPELLKAVNAFGVLLEFSGLSAKVAEVEEKKSEPPGVRVYSSPKEEYIIPDIEPGILRYFRGPYKYEKIPQMEPGEIKIVVTGVPLFLKDGTVLIQ